jgi:hypothetical protein
MCFNGIYSIQRPLMISMAALLCFLWAGISCTPKTSVQSIDYPIQEVEFFFEGPLFEGANEAQVKVDFNPEVLLKEAGLTKEDVRGIHIKSIQLSAQDSSYFDVFESISMQFAGGDEEMRTMASLTSIKKGQSRIELTPVQGVSYEGVKSKPSFYLVMDANLKGNLDDNLKVNAAFVLSIDLK